MNRIRTIFFCACASLVALIAPACRHEWTEGSDGGQQLREQLRLTLNITWESAPPPSGYGYSATLTGAAEEELRNETAVTLERAMTVHFATERIDAAATPVVRIFGTDGRQIVRDIDLARYFDHFDVDLTETQHYEIDVEVRPDGVALNPGEDVIGWEEGGYL